MERLDQKRVVITGAGSGIGRAVALRLAREGARVGVLDVRADAAAATAESVVDLGGSAVSAACDVGDETSVVRAIGTVASAFGGLDSVVACAGIVTSSHTEHMSLANWESTLRVNTTGVFLSVKHSLPHLLRAGGGTIVTIGSVASLVAAGRSSAYDASKGAVLQFTRSIAVEYADRGIRANCVCPGRVATELGSNSDSLTAHKELGVARPSTAARTAAPMTRASDPDEIAAAVEFLCSEDSSFITGVALPVDGGFTSV